MTLEEVRALVGFALWAIGAAYAIAGIMIWLKIDKSLK